MSRRLVSAALAALALAACGQEAPAVSAPAASATDSALAPAIAAVQPLDYAQPAHWLCRPETDDACEQVANATIVAADGTLAKDNFLPAANAPIDCLYVYPTVSRDAQGNADASPGPEEQEIVRQQFARFGAVCRLYAPVYRQATFTALSRLRAGEDVTIDRERAYADVKAAWRHYLDNDNNNRGVVLIGHDQGAGILTRLIASEIDGKPEQEKLVSAILLGADVETTNLARIGGSFRHIPLCSEPGTAGCVIAYSAFRADAPPPVDSLFGKPATEGMRVACTSPTELDGSHRLKPLLPSGPVLFDEIAAPAPWTVDGATIETPFVALPDLLSAVCFARNGARYLAITVHPDPADPRTDTINGDIIVGGAVRPQWGLHLFDMHLAMGNLVDIVGSQAAVWMAEQATPLDPL